VQLPFPVLLALIFAGYHALFVAIPLWLSGGGGDRLHLIVLFRLVAGHATEVDGALQGINGLAAIEHVMKHRRVRLWYAQKLR